MSILYSHKVALASPFLSASEDQNLCMSVHCSCAEGLQASVHVCFCFFCTWGTYHSMQSYVKPPKIWLFIWKWMYPSYQITFQLWTLIPSWSYSWKMEICLVKIWWPLTLDCDLCFMRLFVYWCQSFSPNFITGWNLKCHLAKVLWPLTLSKFVQNLISTSIGPFTLAKTKIQKTLVFCCTVYTARKPHSIRGFWHEKRMREKTRISYLCFGKWCACATSLPLTVHV